MKIIYLVFFFILNASQFRFFIYIYCKQILDLSIHADSDHFLILILLNQSLFVYLFVKSTYELIFFKTCLLNVKN